MHQKERIKAITEILQKNGYVTVKFLTEELHYSTATINRDLNAMKNQKLIARSYGGAELVTTKSVPLLFRYNKMRPAKNKIAQKAAELVEDGDTIFIDGSTTTQYIGKYITEKKNLTVITNNITLASFLSEYNIKAICLGGEIVEIPSMCGGDTAVENVKRYGADKMFFSTSGVTGDGKITTSVMYNLMHKAMLENSKRAYFLVDHEKIKDSCHMYLGDLSLVDGVITDFVFPPGVKEKYKNTRFIEVK